MRKIMLALLPLAMGILVSCNDSKKANCCPLITNTLTCSGCCDTSATPVAKPVPAKPSCDCDAVEKKFAEIKANRDSTFSTATAQLEAQLTSKPSCLVFNGTTSWSCGKYSGRDAGNSQSQLVLGGF